MTDFTLPAGRLTWVFAGDSITQGVVATQGHRSWVELVAERVRWQLDRLNDVVVQTGMSGWTSAQVLTEAEWLVGRFSPDVLSLSLGTNDAHTSHQMSPRQTRDSLVALGRRHEGAQLVVHTPVVPARSALGPGSTRPSYLAHVDAVRAAADDLDATLVDHWTHWEARWGAEEPLAWLHDPIHPNARGHVEMANLTLRTLGLGDLEPEDD